ncbi:MAG: aldehyde dehydrogenase family protein [Candidatus Eiseniibacteriota bacterium]|nr:MAG: aldehyde dehydrogenase family protein [Candidatus Eisenbacteria bacterium]
MVKKWGFPLGGEWVKTDEVLEVRSPYDGSVVAEVCRPSAQHVEKAASAAVGAFETMRRLGSYERSGILEKVSAGIARRAEELSRALSLEAGKTIRDARVEVARASNTFKVAGEEARRIGGEYISLDWIPGSDGRFGITRRFPVGPVLGIAPFNFPLNLVAHKVAPAIAAGNSVVIKPASSTPVCALMLGEILLEAGLPAEAISVLPCKASVAEGMVADERFKVFSFTGSSEIGWRLKTLAGKKKVTLELGGNAAAIVDREVPLEGAAERCVRGGFSNAGQICISVQRICVQEDVYEPFVDLLVACTKALVVGDPIDEKTDVGPLIDRAAAEKTEQWVQKALKGGARALTGASRDGNLYQPTVLVDVVPKMEVSCCEVFAPVVVVTRFSEIEEAIEQVNDSDFGLQAGIFTRRLDAALEAFERLEVGGVIVNDVPTYRVDHMPYGGVKDSGFGREGLRYAIEEMTELRLLAFNTRT